MKNIHSLNFESRLNERVQTTLVQVWDFSCDKVSESPIYGLFFLRFQVAWNELCETDSTREILDWSIEADLLFKWILNLPQVKPKGFQTHITWNFSKRAKKSQKSEEWMMRLLLEILVIFVWFLSYVHVKEINNLLLK